VAIILSTRNGACFLLEQLQSFLDQSFARWTLHWRDDASDDETPAMMREFAAGPGAGRVVEWNDNQGRLGILGSFLTLLRRAPGDSIIAFADQDDVWLPEKLARGVAAISRLDANTPVLYCARQMLVDATLHPIRLSSDLAQPPGFPQALTQNIATGCTVMLNPAASKLLAEAEEPSHTLHDWWAYLLVTAAGGQVVFDREPTVLYRQHPHNAVGVPLSRRKRAVAALRRGPNIFMRSFRGHVTALASQPEKLAPPARETLRQIADGLNDGVNLRLRALAHPGLRRQSWAETQLFRLWFLLG
jgi:glycosyltransferase involved in cell wall biosynthesis